MKSRQVDKKTRKQIPIDARLHQLVKVMAAELGIALKTLVEEYIVDGLGQEKRKKKI